jgi:hypothetical protein
MAAMCRAAGGPGAAAGPADGEAPFHQPSGSGRARVEARAGVQALACCRRSRTGRTRAAPCTRQLRRPLCHASPAHVAQQAAGGGGWSLQKSQKPPPPLQPPLWTQTASYTACSNTPHCRCAAPQGPNAAKRNGRAETKATEQQQQLPRAPHQRDCGDIGRANSSSPKPVFGKGGCEDATSAVQVLSELRHASDAALLRKLRSSVHCQRACTGCGFAVRRAAGRIRAASEPEPVPDAGKKARAFSPFFS